MADGTTLRIRALEKEDSCTLRVRVVFASGEVHRQTFRLSVFEPVPDPEIRPHLVSRTAEVCNVTLHCLGSEKGGIEVSWERGNSSDQPGVPEEGSDADLHVSWRPDSLDSTFTCLLSNPADQKSASLDLANICRSEDGCQPLYVWILGLVAFLILVAGVGVWLWKKRSHPKASPLTKPEKRAPPEYAEVQKRRSPPEGDDEQDPDRFSPCLPEIPPVTPTVKSLVRYYDTLQDPC
ncbi:T-lymphocyte surface antigen Ly-9-like isoform X1 [Sphaerodactylus townsendi]|uniref:T-lymphocyte surface antigen Ly-9-like isoform X1 n=1 Tax=Sphaerodactylus townsendi TaxID=933632 RepID=UPI0020271FB8|nr:T-lymphocyte surface antigen Ly-9-like isoform X1 [Sphaerodactylus townsendi]